jgi:hypothetical protein
VEDYIQEWSWQNQQHIICCYGSYDENLNPLDIIHYETFSYGDNLGEAETRYDNLCHDLGRKYTRVDWIDISRNTPYDETYNEILHYNEWTQEDYDNVFDEEKDDFIDPSLFSGES